MLKKSLLIVGVLLFSSASYAREPERSGSYPGSSLRQTERLRGPDGNTRGFIDRGRDGDSIIRDSSRRRVGSSDREQGRTVYRDREGFTRGSVGR